MHLPVEQLYKDWRLGKGDKSVSETLASRFDTWFHALSLSKLGASYTTPYDTACSEFSRHILSVRKVADLIPFAHSILEQEIQKVEPTSSLDYSTPMLENKQPYELLESIWSELVESDKKLLMAAYGRSNTLDNLRKQGHYPEGIAFALLKARSALKVALKKHAQISFSYMDELSNRDLAPLPLYEAKAFSSEKETISFEHWLINSPDICTDLIEFAPFAHSMRNGALAKLAKNNVPTQNSASKETTESEPKVATIPMDMEEEESDTVKLIILGIIISVVLFAIYLLVMNNDTPASDTPAPSPIEQNESK